MRAVNIIIVIIITAMILWEVREHTRPVPPRLYCYECTPNQREAGECL